jgi:hypothetical protein
LLGDDRDADRPKAVEAAGQIVDGLAGAAVVVSFGTAEMSDR